MVEEEVSDDDFIDSKKIELDVAKIAHKPEALESNIVKEQGKKSQGTLFKFFAKK